MVPASAKRTSVPSGASNSRRDEDGDVREVIDDPARAEREEHRANACARAAEARHRADGAAGEEVRRQRLHVVNPDLKAEQHERDERERDEGALREGREDARGHQERGGTAMTVLRARSTLQPREMRYPEAQPPSRLPASAAT